MKVQLIARSYYEDAYLDFFLKYYINLNFDRIVILKTDHKELGEYKIPTDLEDSKEKIIIQYVKNEGNNIYRNRNYLHFFKDTNYDWTLLIDMDEFLIFDMNKYKNIQEFINSINEQYNSKLLDIKLRWLCINKLNNNYDLENNLNNIHNLTSDNKYSFLNYILTNRLEQYKFIKTLYKTSIVNNSSQIFAHFIKSNKLNETNMYLDNKLINSVCVQYKLFNKTNNYANGFILHFNTRSYSNALTKCLVTKLRDSKKIKNLVQFKNFINTLNIDKINKNDKEYINNIKRKYVLFLNHKYTFPIEIKNYNSRYKKLINFELILDQIYSMINNKNNLLVNDNFVNIETEKSILQKLCNDKKINYNKLNLILNLF